MVTKDQLDQLDQSWDLDEGFLGKLRKGVFDHQLYQKFISLLRSISLDEEFIPKDVITFLWYIPLFMEWQKERVQPGISLEEYNFKKTEIENQLELLLGIP